MRFFRLLFCLIAFLSVYGSSYASSCAVYNCHADDGSGRWGAHNFVRVDAAQSPCAPCHKPHNAGNQIPLWNDVNQYDDGASYQAYVSPTNTLDGGQDAQINTVSKVCMTCHDGMSESTGFTASYFINYSMGRLDINYNKANHPIGVVYGADPKLNTNVVNSYVIATSGSFKLVNNKVECVSCHDPHKKGSMDDMGYTLDVKKLLRTTDVKSFCQGCHIK